jgi:hypothetical protein
MKLDRLTSFGLPPRTDAPPGHRPGATGLPVAPVASSSEADADRRRSLRQDMDEIEARAIGPFEGEGQIMAKARQVAEGLTDLGAEAARLLRPENPRLPSAAVDEEA